MSARSGERRGTYLYLAQPYLRAEPVGDPVVSGADLTYMIEYVAPYYTEYAFIELSFGSGPFIRSSAILGNGSREVAGQIEVQCPGAASWPLQRIYLRRSGGPEVEWMPVPPGVHNGALRLVYTTAPIVPPAPPRTSSIAGVATGRRARFV